MKTQFKILFAALFLVAFTTSCSKDDDMATAGNPSTFNLLFVNNNATEVSFTPTFTWEESTNANGGTIAYDLYLQKANDVPSGSLPALLHKNGITTNTYTVTEPLLASTQYKWYVKARNTGGGATDSNGVFSFMTAAVDNLPPNPFGLVSPFDNETDVPSDPVLSWQAASDPENDPIVYDVYLGENTPVRIGAGLQATTLAVGSLLPETTYYWYVQAFDTAGNGRNSSIFSFTTGDGSGGGNGSYTIVSSNSIATQEGRFGHQMLEYNNKLWILGGTSISTNGGQSGELNDVWSSDINGQTWELVKGYTEPPVGFQPSEEHQAVVFRNEMWVLNGNRNTAHKSSDGITWENVGFTGNVSQGTHYSPRNQFQAVVFNDRLYLIGGLSGGVPQNDVWSTDGVPDTNGLITWVRNVENAAFSPRYGHQVAVFNNRMILVAGSNAGGTLNNDVWSSTDGSTWSLLTSNAPFTIRTEHVLVVQDDGNFLHLLGGNGLNPNDGSSLTSLNDTWVMDHTNTWYEIEPHIDNVSNPQEYRGRKEFDAVSVGGKIIITMGKSGTILLNDTWEFDAL